MGDEKAICEKCKKVLNLNEEPGNSNIKKDYSTLECDCPHCGKHVKLVHDGCGGKIKAGKSGDEISEVTAYRCEKCDKVVNAVVAIVSWPKD
jgi:DNA-directed RNA polymerase subunit RPC12/RpoP